MGLFGKKMSKEDKELSKILGNIGMTLEQHDALIASSFDHGKKMQQEVKCPNCGQYFVFEDGCKLASSKTKQWYPLVMCVECESLFESGHYDLGKDVTNKKSEYFLQKYL